MGSLVSKSSLFMEGESDEKEIGGDDLGNVSQVLVNFGMDVPYNVFMCHLG